MSGPTPNESFDGSPLAAVPVALRFHDISKQFGGQLAVDNVSFDLVTGQVHALVGENGAGKSTLIKILAGEYRQDHGSIELLGEPVVVGHAWERRNLGLGFIHQDPALIGSMTIAENILLGEGFRNTKMGLIPWAVQSRTARQALSRVGLDADPRARLDTLSVSERQLVAVAAVLVRQRRVVVFDEPTASLTESEATRLFAIIRQMRTDGVAVLYVSHRMEEIFALADVVTVMKDGRHVTTRPITELSLASLSHLIVGDDHSEKAQLLNGEKKTRDSRLLPEASATNLVQEPAATVGASSPPSAAEPVLWVQDLNDELMRGINFVLNKGEVLGLAGLAGAGRSNVLRALFGASEGTGSVTFNGKTLRLRHPADAIAEGIVMVTEERKLDGYISDFPVWKTITLPWLKSYSRAGWLRIGKEIRAGANQMREFDVRAPSPRTAMRDLSGGNQQKAILARWLSQDVNLALLDEPTHGVDVGAKDEIHALIRTISSRGIPVILVSSELEELGGLCTRVLMLVRGRVVDELSGNAITKANMLRILLAEQPAEESHSLAEVIR